MPRDGLFILAHLSPIEQQIAKGKSAGHSDDEIAHGCGTSYRTIFNAWRRLKRKMLSRAQRITRPRPLDWKGSQSI
jgi:DNA-binding NarL/FixJ family response regulator